MLLIIGGFDPTGKAGILADVSMALKIGVPYRCCITTNTIQTEESFTGQSPTLPELFKAQLDGLLGSESFTGVKLGFIPDLRLAEIVRDSICKYRLANVVVDPVIVGKRANRILVGKELLDYYLNELLPLAAVSTPNWSEACVLSGSSINEALTHELMEETAKIISAVGKCSVLISGKSINNKNYDCLFNYDKKEVRWFEGKSFVFDKPLIGIGCRFSTAIASYLSKGFELEEGVKRAKAIIEEYLNTLI